MPTWQLGLVIWLITGVVLAGSGVLVVVTVPSLADQGARLIPMVAGAGFVLALIASFVIAGRIKQSRS